MCKKKALGKRCMLWKERHVLYSTCWKTEAVSATKLRAEKQVIKMYQHYDFQNYIQRKVTLITSYFKKRLNHGTLLHEQLKANFLNHAVTSFPVYNCAQLCIKNSLNQSHKQKLK